MALANFFEKAALAASHVLRGFSPEAFCKTLESKEPALFFDASAEATLEGRWILELAIDLLARLYPTISIVSPPGSKYGDFLRERARAINPLVTLNATAATSSVCMVVGNTSPNLQIPTIFVGSNRWITKASTETPLGCGSSQVPYGALAAACIGAANIFRSIFSSQLADSALDRNWQVSLIEFDPKSASPLNPDFANADLSETHLVGLGAVGSACIWALARTPGLSGHLHLIDNQKVELSNLQRYVLSTQTDVGRPKVELAKACFEPADLTLTSHQLDWGNYLGYRNDWLLRRVAVAVDSAVARQGIQASLPEWTVNAWTQIGDLGISRHSFLGTHACLTCLYFPDANEKNEDEIIAEGLGLSQQRLRVRYLLQTGEPITPQDLQLIAEANQIAAEELSQYGGQPLRAFYANAICGGALLRLGANAENLRQVEVPMAFQSALAGVLLAGEIVVKGAGLRDTPTLTTTKFDLMRPLPTRLSAQEAKNFERCICRDPYYIRAYERKYLSQGKP